MSDVDGSDIAAQPESAPSQTMHLLGAESFHEFVRYFFASAVALLADMGALSLLTSVIGVPYLISGAISFTIGLVLVYVLSVRWVFAERHVASPMMEFLLFTVIGVIGLGLNELVLWVLTGGLGIFYLYSKIVSVIFVFTWNFVARKYLLFR